jgi:archaellin
MTAWVAGTGYPLTFDSTSGTWASSATVPIPPNAGPLPVELRWQAINTTIAGSACSTTFRNNNPCQGSFGTVQRVFSANEDRSGPVKVAQIWENGSFWANSFERGTTHDLVVKIGITGNLQVASSVSDPLVKLRVTGSQNQSVDCDPDLPNLATEIELGCTPEYRVNDGTPCPDTYSDLQRTPEPWNCVAIQTGGAVGQVERGMRNRILGGANTCTSPNNWDQFPNIPPDDPRIVPIFLTPFGTFTGSGNDVIPVTGFATFYVTGWFGSPCADDDPVDDRGYIVGRFIKYIFTLNEGGAGEDLCDFTSIGSCIAVLTE